MLTKIALTGCLVLSALALVAACSSSESASAGSSSGSDTADASGTSNTSDGSAPAGNTVAGTIGGKAFTIKSGFGYVDKDGALDLVLSSEDGLCDSVKQSKIHPGEMLVQLYTLKGTAPGAFVPEHNDVKYATVASTCPSGEPLGQANVEKAARATSTTVTIAALTATAVDGTVSITFEDGSSVSGDFNLPTCSSTTPESSICF
jgi:hypothetical protein